MGNNLGNLISSSLTVVIVMLGLMVFFSMVGFDLVPVEDKTLEKVVTVEKFTENMKNRYENFCKQYLGKTHELNDKCKEFTKESCMDSSCCVYTKMNNKEKCFAGNKHGPVYKRDNEGKTHDIDYYYYQNVCYGNGCPKE